MPLYRVVNRYRDRSTGERVEPGTLVNLSLNAGRRMVARGLVAPVERQKQPETATRTAPETSAERTLEPKHVGGGWYELPGGSRVRGKDAALERMQD